MFFGHPLGLLIISMNEIWERFSFYGMKAILVLYMIAEPERGGMGLSFGEAGAIYGLYSCLAATTILPGGWMADVLLGPRAALLWGGVIIALGHVSLAFANTACFFIGLGLIVVGTGLLKPSSTIMVSHLYPEDDPRQESGYTIYYMCINIGALLGPLVCGYLAMSVSWHTGFGAAAVGMLIGLAVYVFGFPALGGIGRAAGTALDPVAVRRNVRLLLVGCGVVLGVVLLLSWANGSGRVSVSFSQISRWLGVALIALPIVYFALLFTKSRWTRVERNHLIVVVLLFFFSIFFWAAADQRGSLLMLFADRMTHCVIGDWAFPAAWFASVNPAFIILLTPVFAWLWPALGRRNPSTPAKFAWAMFFTALSFLVLVGAALAAGPERAKVGPEWLLIHFFFITIAEMCLSPVGISAFARLAPRAVASQVMGVWFLRGSIAGLLAGAAGSAYEDVSLVVNFSTTAIVVSGVGVLLVFLTPMIRRFMASPSDAVRHAPAS